ncbi:DLIC-domain-containing protein [Calocera viscosa TUFC12733]|uniref:DLIC-domain-containing protein n=1 Tax=Calocera viscosa (strain TUFC12733) TaxID=1330018 RepID=A0A167NVQ1_CALVF|nr:DLIC-domain-containing protein [Calocera viscosa TUFC12733]
MSVRSSSPVQELWSSILNSVSSTRSIPSKNILVLGEEHTGKSTLVKALLRKTEDEAQSADFALGYGWADVKDDADEDTLARLSVYSVPSSAPSHLALVDHFLPPRTSLPHTSVVIVLDWTRPWTFVSQLEKWLKWVEHWAEGEKGRDLDMLHDEAKERLRLHIQHYTEPGSTDSSNPASLSSTLLPLGDGILTSNAAGVPIIVVCTKADLMDDSLSGTAGPSQSLGIGGMTKNSMWEERQDAIIQVLRTICLKYGAALFYTTHAPQTLANLRSYALHLLFIPTPVAPNEPLPRNPFPFAQRANALDRDRILIPVGWDSWGKIKILREDFDVRRWGEGWESDLDSGEAAPVGGAQDWFKEILGPHQDIQAKAPPPLIVPKAEQAFLSSHYEALQKDRDPRATFRQPIAVSGQAGAVEAGVVGPMGSSSFNLPGVEKAMQEMETEDPHSGREVPARTTPAPMAPTPRPARLPVSPTDTIGRTPGTPGGNSQTEVLQNFFQSLLVPNRSGSSARSASVAQPKAPSGQALSPSATAPAEGVNGVPEK